MLLPLLLRTLMISLFLGPLAFQASAQVPETDFGRILVDFHASDKNRAWVAAAHELNVLNMFKDSPRLQSIPKDTLPLAACSDFDCRRKILRGAGIDLYIEGTVGDGVLQYRALVPETEQVLSEGAISIAANTTPELVKTGFLHAMKPFTESGGILDQRIALRRAEKVAAAHGPRGAKLAMGITLAFISLVILIGILVLFFRFRHGRPAFLGLGFLWTCFALGPLWLISEELALVKPVAAFAMPDPWVLAVLSGLGVGWALWGFGLCILPQLRGLETLKQNRMPLVIDALFTMFVYRFLAALAWAGIAAGLVLGAQKVFGLDKVHSVALALIVFGGLTTISALVFEILAQILDQRYVHGFPTRDNPWHQKVVAALQTHPLLVDLQDLSGRVLFLPTTHDKPLTYGGGITRPRILLPLATLEKAFATRPEDNGLAYDFLAGLIVDGLGHISLRTHLETTLRLGKAIKSGTRILAPYRKSRQLLEGCFLTVHEGLGPFIQYLYWRHNPESELLTVAANPSQMIAITRLILGKFQPGAIPKTIEKPRDHICWLELKFFHPEKGEEIAPAPKRRFPIRPRMAVIIALILLFTGYQLVAAIRYHAVYEDRIAAQKARIEEKNKKKAEIDQKNAFAKEGLDHAEQQPNPAAPDTAAPVDTTLAPAAVGAGGAGGAATKVVAKAVKKKHKLKPKPGAKPKSKRSKGKKERKR